MKKTELAIEQYLTEEEVWEMSRLAMPEGKRPGGIASKGEPKHNNGK